MRWVSWILAATATFVVAALLFPRTTPHLSGSPDPPLTASTSPGAELSGRARVIDGDSILVDRIEVRLYGIDAPEATQTCVLDGVRWPCGRQATRALQSLIEGRVVVCDERDRDNYGRVVAVCRHDGASVNAWLVTNGWAMAYRRHALAYVDAESTAKSAKRGIWRGDFVAPWDWRQAEAAGVRATASPSRTADTRSQRSASAPGRCNIKGNISYNSGRRLYHMPGDPDYADTRISAARGERWFCSEAEAQAAGWQPAVRSKR